MEANWTHPQLFYFLDQLEPNTPYFILGCCQKKWGAAAAGSGAGAEKNFYRIGLGGKTTNLSKTGTVICDIFLKQNIQ